jgi:small subunit ribosomal protein S3Ae
MAEAKKKVDVWKKKEWYTIYSPKMFDSLEVGITPTDDEKKLIGRVLRVPLREITNSMAHQFVKMFFRITEVKGKSAYTEFDGFELTMEYLRRNVRRRRSIIKVVRTITTKDDKKIHLTVHTFTARKIDTSKKDAIRKVMIEVLDEDGKANTFEDFIQKAIFGNLASDIFKEIKQIAPAKRIEISKCEIVKGK